MTSPRSTVMMTSFHHDFKITSYISFEFDIFPQKKPICNFTLIIFFLDFPPSYWSEEHSEYDLDFEVDLKTFRNENLV